MAILTYSDLLSAIADWLNRADLSGRIPDFVSLAEAQMNRALRVRRMVTRSTAALDNEFSGLPADFLEAISLALEDGGRLAPAPLEILADRRAAQPEPGRPRTFAVVGAELQLHPAPDRTYGATLVYYAGIPRLSSANPSNWVLATSPDAYLYGALLQAAPFLRDPDGAATWNAGYAAALEGLRAAERTPAGTLRVESALRPAGGASFETF